MNLQQLFFAAYVAYLAPPLRVFFEYKWNWWFIALQTAAGQAQRKQLFTQLLTAPGALGQLDAAIMVQGFDPWWTYNERAEIGAIYGVPPANEPGLGEVPGYALPGAPPLPGQQPYPLAPILGWLPTPNKAQMSAYANSTTPAQAKAWLEKYFPPYAGAVA